MDALNKDDLRIARQALNEVVNGPEAIEDWEFHPRMGCERQEAQDLMIKIKNILEGDK